ncbi:hypothetical protein F8388_014821 [Cannabis sativa]|uniref:Thaumatin-like protein n=1 Tax=Cannabis sativa TaxID=3483 RepID=A0A7J6GZN8_CANSA|nr:hypothetical protein F8388_014821 [Cannabis sativa]
MNTQILFFSLALAFIVFAAGANATTITIKNNCQRTIWPATLGGSSQLSITGFELAPQGNKSVDIPDGTWIGRFWARDICSTDASGSFTCAAGNCGSGKIECNGLSGATPATLVEFTIRGDGGKDFYDVSNVDGFNIPVSVVPQGGSGDCQESICGVNINGDCLPELQFKSGNDVVGCLSGCAKFNEDRFCCTGAFDKPDCPPTDYSRFFEEKCPKAYSYAKDDKDSTFTCTNPNYLITFCP